MDTKVLYKMSKGDKLAFKQVYETYYKSIYLFVRKYIIDEKQTEDIAQEVFIKIWETKLYYPNSLAFKSYLYQTAKNCALNSLAHEEVKKRYQEKVLSEQETDDYFHDNYIEQETYRLIFQYIDKLPSRQKEILYLNLEGYKNQEIANKLGITLSTVKSHKATAYKFLKDNL